MISQTRRGRFSYKFDFIKVLDSNSDEATLLVSGTYRSGPGSRTDATAILVLDKDDKSVDIFSEDFTLDDSEVRFMRGCN